MGAEFAPTRRRVLRAAGVTGAAGLAQAMTGLGPLGPTGAWAAPLQPPAGSGNGRGVLVLGAGIAGLTSAYLLHQAGYDVTVIEAQQRPGGRNFTGRRGTVITENGRTGPVTQICRFDEGQYLNLGPGRLPYHHRRVLDYCRQLGVALEPYVMETTANLVQLSSGFDQEPMVNRRLANDTRGHLAALLNDAVDRGVFDGELTPGEQKSLLELLRVFGDLRDGRYLGSTRSGCAKPETVSQACEPMPPLSLTELLDAQFWASRVYQPVSYLWQPTMFQPVGGMDKIVEGFWRQVGSLVVLDAEVQRITVSDSQVSIAGNLGGRPFSASAEYCVSSIPFPVLRSLPTNLATDFADAVATPDFEATCKVGWQAQSRFWESDAHQIYGGISWTDDMITQMWYPSNDYFTAKGTFTGAYNYDADAIALGELSFPDRLAAAKRGGAKLHPEIADESIVPTALGVSIAWHKVPHQLGGWANWKNDDPAHQRAYRRLLAPDRRFYVTGDQISPLPGWQEGAIMSAEYVCGQIGGQVNDAVPDEVLVPDAKTLTQGG